MMKIRKRFSSDERKEIVAKAKQCLWTAEGEPGLSYVRDVRQISEDTIRTFSLGYIPLDVKHQLAGRIIFPIFDPSENLVCVTSRFIHEEDKEYLELLDGFNAIDFRGILPHYWHESYEKDFHLYGIHLSKHSMRRLGFAIVVEGQFDALQLHDHRLSNTVALCGTKLSDIQLSMIHRYCEEVVVILDADDNRAGQIAAKKVREKVAYPGVNKDRFFIDQYATQIETLLFSENLDPDEYIRKHGIEQLKNLIRHKVEELRKRGH